jgi:two-component system OmpR family sensor kinase
VLRAIALAGGAGLILAVGGSAWLAHRAVRPMADALALQRRFVADASHELRTPLTLLSTRAQLMARRAQRDGDATDRLEHDAAGLVADAANLTSILDDLLTAADIRVAVDVVPVDLANVAHEATTAAQAFAAERGIELVPGGSGPVRLDAANRAGLLRAVTALLDNAITHARHRVEVDVSADGGIAVVEIRDDGPGIALDVVPTMFERFSSSRPTDDGGARRHYGLGLALVAEIARAHGGTISAANRSDGPGAVLTLRIPTTTPARSRVRPAR